MKSFRSSLLLFLLVLGLGGYAYFVEYKGGLKKIEKEEKEKTILKMDKDSIQKISILNSHGNYVFIKKDSQWFFESPFSEYADNSQVENLINQLSGEKFDETVATDGNRAIYGLDKDFNTVEFIDSKGSHKVFISRMSSIGNRKYILRESENNILLGSINWEYLVDRNLNDLISKELVPKKENIQKIVILNKSGSIEFEVKNNRAQLINLKTNDPYLDDVERVLTAIQSLRGIARVSSSIQEKAKYGLNNPESVIEVFYSDNSKEKLTFSKMGPSKEAYAISSMRDGIFSVNEFNAGIAFKKLEDYRDKVRYFKFDTLNVDRITFTSSLSNFSIKKEKEGWKSTDDLKSKEINQDMIQDLLFKLSRLQVKTFFDKNIDYQKSGLNELKIYSKDSLVLSLEWPSRPMGSVFPVKSSLGEFPIGVDIKDISSLPLSTIIVDKVNEPESQKSNTP